MTWHSRTSRSNGASGTGGNSRTSGTGGTIRGLVWPALAVLAVALTGCAGPASSATPPPRATGSPGSPGVRAAAPDPRSSATPFAGASSVGVLINEDGDHFCTASVVDSPKGNVIATAAHCLQDAGGGPSFAPGDLEFAPGFSGKGKGTYPYGRWKVGAIHLDDRWTDDDEDSEAADYAFLTLAPDAKGRQVEKVVGGAVPDWSSRPERRVTVVGYPNAAHNPGNRPIACTTEARPDEEIPGTLVMECAGFWDGTSGGPWLADYRDAKHQGRLIGVLSGGDTDSESTSSLFDDHARELYEQAAG
ncbi:trypsin-like peptidase domain-containing protein [Streptomyces lunaelactis]|uniref:trypsin-like serine protease n=1 Tax=Streptomyces lunaelactis TaxID=1535768 RepID=UPI001584B784|nr:trypsin-like serine protease [Streptomyces lunaelactis]NUK03799.1 trypsin-like peptidase domain-containing protein [Streptomyces lunaelactis]NUK11843.1 trypsin-like peptidase domain-containing protein [Streptomyces lunaelactis]NUK17625.1 trypsin-like peptidase domain-containing protein [Streptomyces lunaelactis]NUK38173.1 trypsin-like peptidase domain-containing protein [Streptomyces lunaelactis]NUK43889.1 trypsin-like peptidase domain-containing protein [Streptomyces lunaelactis]